jgi:hypothetical protein
MKLVFENPFPSNNVGLAGTRDKILSAICFESFKFVLHGPSPERINEGLSAGPGQRR